jgi:hypothetical protein
VSGSRLARSRSPRPRRPPLAAPRGVSCRRLRGCSFVPADVHGREGSDTAKRAPRRFGPSRPSIRPPGSDTCWATRAGPRPDPATGRAPPEALQNPGPVTVNHTQPGRPGTSAHALDAARSFPATAAHEFHTPLSGLGRAHHLLVIAVEGHADHRRDLVDLRHAGAQATRCVAPGAGRRWRSRRCRGSGHAAVPACPRGGGRVRCELFDRASFRGAADVSVGWRGRRRGGGRGRRGW